MESRAGLAEVLIPSESDDGVFEVALIPLEVAEQVVRRSATEAKPLTTEWSEPIEGLRYRRAVADGA